MVISQNPKSEARNPKQIRISNDQMSKTKAYSQIQAQLRFGTFEFWSLDIVSHFGFRASDLSLLLNHSAKPYTSDLARRTWFSMKE